MTFKNIKTKKSTSKKYRCYVKEQEKKALTMTAEATGSREIKATFNKAIGSDAKITLKKGTSDVEMKAVVAEDGMSATITLTGKLSAGTYTVTVVAADETVTADIVTKDEALTSFEIGTTLKEVTKGSATASAIISYKALNQYGEKLNYTPAANAVTVSIGKVGDIKGCKTSQSGTIKVEEIPSMYAIPGQSFTFVIVDTVNNTGITLNTTAVYGASATAAEFTAAGVYNKNKSAFKDVADGNKIGDFELLFTCKDQYGDDMDSKEVAKLASEGALQVTIAGGLTGIKAGALNKDSFKEIDKVTYFTVPFTGASSGDTEKANAGTYTVTIVNNTKGIVYNQEYSVTSGTVIASVQISPKNSIYADQDNEFDFTVTDTDGKEITDYATLKDIEIEGNSTVNQVQEKTAFKWKKNTNGTAKLVYKPLAFVGTDSARPYKNSDIRSCTIKANKPISGKYLVQSQTFTVYYQRLPLLVEGLASGTATVSTGKTLKLGLKDLVILDQYQNAYTADELKADDGTIAGQIWVKAVAPVSAGAITAGAVDIKATVDGALFSNGGKSGVEIAGIPSNATQKVNFNVTNSAIASGKLPADKDGYDATFKSGDAESVGGLYVASVNDGSPLYSNSVNYKPVLYIAGADDKDSPTNESVGIVVIKGKVNGQDVIIEPSQCSLVGEGSNGVLELQGVQSYDLAQKVITETREFSVIVNTSDGPQTITGKVDVSNEPKTAKTISVNASAASSYTVASGQAFDYASADGLFKVKTQYNSIITGCELVTYTVESATVSGAAFTFKNETYGGSDANAKKDVPVDIVDPYLNGSAKSYLKLKGMENTPASGGAITATVVVEGKVAGTDNTAKKTIKIEFKY